MAKLDLLQGTLDLLILKTLATDSNHGWGICHRIRQMSRDSLQVSHGSLYPALHRLEVSGDVRSEMMPSENNRRARVYTITASGRRRLETEKSGWEQFALSIRRVLQAE
jgi:PadR family transcriptional regulator PadR